MLKLLFQTEQWIFQKIKSHGIANGEKDEDDHMMNKKKI